MTAAAALSPAPLARNPAAGAMPWLRQLPVLAHSIDSQGRIVDVSDLWLSSLQYRRGEVVGRPSLDFLAESSRIYAENVVLPEFFRTGLCRDVSYQFVRADGEPIDVLLSANITRAPNGDTRSLAILTDVTAQRLAERRLSESDARFRLLADSMSDMIVMVDRNLTRRYVSPASYELLSVAPEELVGQSVLAAAHVEDVGRLRDGLQALLAGDTSTCTIVKRLRRRDGRWIWVESKYRALRHPETAVVTGLVGVVRDVSARKAAEEQLADAYSRLEVIAGQDGLTGLFNRRSFDEAMTAQCLRQSARRGALSLLLIDVDWFKPYNDRHGHLRGDECLRLVAKAIQRSLYRGADFAARYGGEEFAVIAPEADECGAAVIAERIRRAVRELKLGHAATPFERITVSVGVASAMAVGYRPDALIACADRALYAAKDRGRDQFVRASELAAENL